MVLRIHRGRQSTTQSNSAHSNNGSTYMNNGSEGVDYAAGTPKARLKCSSSYTSNENDGVAEAGVLLSHSHSMCDTREFVSVAPGRPTRATIASVGHRRGTEFAEKSARRSLRSHDDVEAADEVSPDHGESNDKFSSRTPSSPKSKSTKDLPAKRNAKFQAKRFRMETKAAKTLAIIVGGFIVCWLPFFTVYLLRPFCTGCTPDIVFSVLFWLGYCNSAINPLIYALFSKDFRNAFQQIIIRVCCPSYFAANRAYFSPNKRKGKRPPFPFPHPFMSGPPEPPAHSASSNNLAQMSNSERFR